MDDSEPEVVFTRNRNLIAPSPARSTPYSRKCSSCLGPIHETSSQDWASGSINQNESTLNTSRSSNGLLPNDKHCHERKTLADVDKRARRKLIIASALAFTFMIGEIAGGVFAHSLAIVSDAAHLLTDLASFMISLLAIYLASRRATKKLSFGWYRAEILGAMMSIVLLWVITGILVYMAVERVVSMDYEIDATIMLITAACGVAFNMVMGLTLHHGGHGHSHGGNSQGNSNHSNSNHSEDKEKLHPPSDVEASHNSYGTFNDLESEGHEEADGNGRTRNINVKAAFIHVLGDLLQSVGVLVAAFIIYFKPEWKVADPICTFMFSILVLITTFTIMKDIIVVLMEGTPRGVSFTDIRRSLAKLKDVRDVHDLRVWSLSMDKTALSVHLAVSRSADALSILQEASCMVQRKYGITETTIQVEEFVDDMIDCTHCQDIPD